MAVGLAVGDKIRQEFQNLRMRRKHRYIIYKLSEDLSATQIEKIGARTETWEDFKEALPKDRSR